MTKQNEYEPDYLVSPGEVVDDYLTAMGREKFKLDTNTRSIIDLVIQGTQPITPAIAAKLEKLGRPAHFWLNLEQDYQADRARLSGISPWRKVEDQPPPKDGSIFLLKLIDEVNNILYYQTVWNSHRGQWQDELGAYDEFPKGSKWMPIPKEGK